MTTSRRKNVTLIMAAVAASALLLAGCSGQASNDPNAPITLKLSTFGNFGYTDELIASYEKTHPNIKIVQNIAASSDEARTNLFTKLAAGNGLADIEALEIGWTVDLRQYANKFVPVEKDKNGGWVDYQTAPVTTDDGTMFAYGAAAGPEAICYRSDLLAAAGLPSDPAAVSALIGDTWDGYFAAGDQYLAGGGKAWYDSAWAVYTSQIEQLAYPYEKADDTIVADSADVERIFRDTLAVSAKLSAKLTPYSDDWASATGNGGFATMACPSWMLGVIEGNSKGVTGWNVANTFPGGGGNQGGSFLSVPTQSQHPKEASELAAWLTAPEQQIAAFTVAGAWPSRLEALDSPDLTSITNPFFSNAPIGQIFSDRAKAIGTVAYKGPHFVQIDSAAFDAITRVETGTQSIDDSWKQFVGEVKKLKK